MSRRPLVTAIVSTYNAEALLPACLRDLEAQTIADRLEIIVIDSGSEQDERAVVERFQRRYDNIVYRRTARETLYASWNRAIRLARGPYITNANTDDAHRRDALELLAAALDAHPEADLAYADYAWTPRPNDTFRDPHADRVVIHPPYHPAQTMFFCVTGCHPMWRRALFDRIGHFDPRFRAISDYEFLMRFAAAGRRAVHVPEVLSLFHQNPRGLSFAESRGAREAAIVQPRYRRRTPIHRLYKVAPRRPAEVAAAWTALGDVAMRCDIPWTDEPAADWRYALECYERALAAEPTDTAGLYNAVIVSILLGRTTAVPRRLGKLASGLRDTMRSDLRAGRIRLLAGHPPPARVDPVEFVPRGPRRRDPLSRSLAKRRVTAVGRESGRAPFLDGGTVSRRARAALREIFGGSPRGAAKALSARTRARLRPRLARGMRVRAVQDGYLLHDRDGTRLHFLNRSAALVVELCTGRNSWREIADLVAPVQGGGARGIRAIDALLTRLLEQGALVTGRARARRHPAVILRAGAKRLRPISPKR